MLTIFRRHLKTCRFKAKGRKHHHCNCPLSVEGRLHGTMIRKSLDIRSWEAGQKLIRDWEAGAGKAEIPSVDNAMGRYINDLTSRGLSPDSIRKIELLREELIGHFPSTRVDHVMADDLGKYKESWSVRPSTAIKKLERLRSFFKFCVERDGWRKILPTL